MMQEHRQISSRASILPVIAAVWIMQAAAGFADIAVVTPEKASVLEKQVALELVSSLQKIYPADKFSLERQMPSAGKAILIGLAEDEAIAGRIGNERLAGPEGYVVTTTKQGELELGIIAGADARGAAYGVYALLRKLGCGFYISYDALPAAKPGPFSFDGWQLSDKPLVQDRLVFDWHNFLSGCSTWNLAEWKSWILQSQKQGYNAVMVHAYGNNPMAGFTFNGKTKTVGYLSTTERGRDWSTMHVNDVRKLWGGEVFGGRVFGAEAAMGPEALRADAARKLMGGVFAYAGDRKMDVYFAIDVDTISANPQELITTLPESARFAVNEGKVWLANPETPEGYAYYKAQVAELLRAYPQITHLTVWFRLVPVGLTPWLTLKSSEMPERWQAEYDAEVAKSPDVAKFWKPHNMFAIGKIVKAFERALKERGDNRVQLAAGSWCFDFMPAADLFFPRQVKFIGLDYRVLINKSMLSTREQREKLAEVGAHRSLIPVIWAHHDDGSYIGRPYTPFTDFRTKLTEAKACGFGIIHWTTRPLDLFFSSHANQVWQQSENQPLQATCREMAEKSFGPAAQEAMREYLERWAVEAPMFARDTRDYFIDRPLTNIEQVVAGCSERLKLIERVDAAKLTPGQRDRLNYYKGMEEFVAAFHRTQQKFQMAERLWKTGDVAAARAELAGCQPEKVIEQYAKVSSLGGITRGEQGLVVSMNTRWLAHYTRLRQELCMEPVRYNFGPTSHDPMAQCKGTFTYHVDVDHQMWQTLGAEETGAGTFALPDGVKIAGGEGGSAVYREICRSGLESDKPVKITVRPIMATGKLLKGDYLLRLVLFDPTSTAAGQRVFRVLPGNNEEVDIFKAAGGANRIHVLSCPVTIGESGELAVTLTPVKGKAVISGLVLEPASSGDNMTRSALASAIAGGCLLTSQEVTAAAIVCPANASPTLRLAAREVQRYVYLRTDQLLPTTERLPDRGDAILLAIDPSLKPQHYTLKTTAGSAGKALRIAGGSDVAVLYGAYHWAEKLGVRFYLHGDVIPDGKIAFALPHVDEHHKPLFDLRGVNPWGSHSEGMDLWNTDDYIQVFGQLAKLRMNFLGIHSYPEDPKPRSQYDSEATVWIGPPGDFDKQGRVSQSFSASYFNALRDGQWGYIPRATGDYRFGASLLFERDDWGPDVMLGQCPVPTTPEGCNEVFNRTGQMFNEAFSAARKLGVKTCIGTESPLTIPEAVKARLLAQHKDPSDPAVVRELYTGIFKRIAAAHPLDYYWLWTPEKWLWSGNSEKETQAFIEDFQQAVQALKDAGAPFELATCGWVLGPKQDRSGWTRTLPPQISVSALSEAYSGAVDPAFAKIAGRGKWAIPWLEEDNSILGPQLWVSRIRKDAADALAYGCTGLMGLHWRTREVGPQIAALAQAGWSQDPWNPQAGNNPPGVPQTLYYEGPKPPYGRQATDCGSTTQPIAGTEDDPLYQSYRLSLCGYRLKVPNGRYRVTLGFIEPQHKQAGQRVFAVNVQERPVAEKLDIYEKAGYLTAVEIHADNVQVKDGWLHLDLQPVTGQTCIAAIAIEGDHFKRKVNCGGMAYRDYEADPPRTKTFNWGPKDTAYEQRGLPCDDFYLDWAIHNFGHPAGPRIAALFTRLDGRVPLVSSFDGGAGSLNPDERPWELVEKEFAFLNDLEALQPRVEGAGNRDRYEYWLNMFRHLKAQARVRCIWGQLNAAVADAKAESDPAKRKALIEGEVFTLRNGMTQAIADAYKPLFGIVSSPGGMATVINWEGHVYRNMIHRPEQALEKLYGQPLPPPPALTQRYQGPPRLIVPTVRTMVKEGEALTVKVIVLDNERPAVAALHWRLMGQGAYRQIALSHVDRGVHRVTLPPAGDQSFEYYITATTAGGQQLAWPATAPQNNQTVVVLPASAP